MRVYLFAGLLLAFPVLAQERLTPEQQLEQAQRRLEAVVRQRNEAHDRLAVMEAELLRLAAELQKAQTELAKKAEPAKK